MNQIAPSTRQLFQPNGNAITVSMVIWAYARLNRCQLPDDLSYFSGLDSLNAVHGPDAVQAAFDTYDRDLYIKQGWEAAL